MPFHFERLEDRLSLTVNGLGCICEPDASNAWLVQWASGDRPAEAFVAAEKSGVLGWERVTTRCQLTKDKALSLLGSSVLSIEEDASVSATGGAFSEPLESELYGLSQIDVYRAWGAQANGAGAVVAVLDTGIDDRHTDLAPNVWRNALEVPGNGIDDDGNGYVDDDSGWDFFANDNDPTDENGHGTHVAGTIAAVGGNGEGLVGVAPQAKVLPVRFLGPGGSGSVFDAARAISYITELKQSGKANVVAINASWGSSGYSQALTDAINVAGEAGILFIAAAGNSGRSSDSRATWPANTESPYVISVASTNEQNDLSSFSNFGTSVHIGAPGEAILSTVPGNRYEEFSGTSMAAPHVSGAVAILSSALTESPRQIRERILSSGDPLTSLAGKTAYGTRLNVGRSLLGGGVPPALPPTVPSVYLDGSVLRVQDVSSVFVTQDGRDSYVVTTPEKAYRFRWFDVFRIEAVFGPEDSYFENKSDLPSKVWGGDGNDTLIGGSSRDVFFGELGNDLLLGGKGMDELRGGGGRDELRGGKGADLIRGGRGVDTLIGGAGLDLLHGGQGADLLYVDRDDETDSDRADSVRSR